MRLNLVAGMAAHQHHRFRLNQLDQIFTAPLWQRAQHRTFQLSLNHLYVFERSPHLPLSGNREGSGQRQESR
jgi:hypothetical protein